MPLSKVLALLHDLLCARQVQVQRQQVQRQQVQTQQVQTRQRQAKALWAMRRAREQERVDWGKQPESLVQTAYQLAHQLARSYCSDLRHWVPGPME